MIILDFFLLCFLILLLYLKDEDLNSKNIIEDEIQIKTIENLDLYNSDSKNNIIDNIDNINYIKNNIKLNDYNVEVDRPIFSYSNCKNDKTVKINNDEEELINNVYDKLVDDNRIQNINYDNLNYYNSNDNYYNIENNDIYGYTNFMTYKK
jgi:hypothetical protein